jgi:hypothetical protein
MGTPTCTQQVRNRHMRCQLLLTANFCRFNIWNTGPDLNFDRIAHLAKLVFNTKGVYISLVDGDEQWVMSTLHHIVY